MRSIFSRRGLVDVVLKVVEITMLIIALDIDERAPFGLLVLIAVGLEVVEDLGETIAWWVLPWA